ncbi:calcium/calmodulin-dependent 3',5'-cyclic nucleotide phosphodiesterase 1A isoform X4 [Tachysurus ichikawai]
MMHFLKVANETGESHPRPLARFARSKSQNALWNAITAGIGIRDKDKRGILIDPRSPEEILADELPAVDSSDAMEKTAISGTFCQLSDRTVADQAYFSGET